MGEQNRPLSALLNIGPRTARRLAEIGILDEAALRRTGAIAAYRALKFAEPRATTLVALYALHGALHDTHWNALPMETRAALRSAASSAGDEGTHQRS